MEYRGRFIFKDGVIRSVGYPIYEKGATLIVGVVGKQKPVPKYNPVACCPHFAAADAVLCMH
jgi:hypothetical protein